jgi:hypothetical protein
LFTANLFHTIICAETAFETISENKENQIKPKNYQNEKDVQLLL